MTANFGVLINRARSFCRDAGAGFIEDDDLGNWINEAQTDIAARTEVLDEEVTGLTSDTIAYPSPDMVNLRTLRLGDNDVEFVTEDSFNFVKDRALTTLTTIARAFGDVIELYPTPETNTPYVLRYAQIPFPLVQSSDEHILPAQMERKLIEYAVAQAKYKDGEPNEGDRWLARYEQGLPHIDTTHRRFEQLTITRMQNAWDVQRGATHV